MVLIYSGAALSVAVFCLARILRLYILRSPVLPPLSVFGQGELGPSSNNALISKLYDTIA